ncbi:MAG: hypothetical protein U0401_28605 [Anaerolineae bacterium]
MLAAFFSPLAPAAVLLLGAFLLPLVVFQLPLRWRTQPWLRSFGAPGLVGLAIVALLGVRLTFGADAAGQGLETLSGWNFTAAEPVALNIRADTLSLPFLMLTSLILLAVTLATPLLAPTRQQEENVSDLAIWLALGASACFLFVSANGLTLIYAVFGFDVLTMFYWLQRGQRHLSLARVFLGVFTAFGLTLATLTPASGLVPGATWLGLALWLRLGLYPFLEATRHTRSRDEHGLTYVGLSVSVGLYVAARVLTKPLPDEIVWLAILLALLNGVLAWLSAQPADFLARLLLVEALLALLMMPLGPGVITAASVGLILSLIVLWLTPRLGQPRLNEGAWSWPYLPALAATLTLVGLPFSLGWLARTTLYGNLFYSGSSALAVILIMLAEALAFSGLIRYWFTLWQGDEINERRSLVSIVVMVPFLIPGLALLVLSTMTKTELPPADFNQPLAVWLALLTTLVGAFGLEVLRPRWLSGLGLSAPELAEWVNLDWLLIGLERMLNHLGKFVLRLWVIVEGQHYLGWALLTALVGVLVILLST